MLQQQHRTERLAERGTNLDPTIKLGVYELNNLYALYNVDLVEASIEPLETVLENPCGNLPPDLCMQRLEYTIVVNLPASDTGYDLIFQRCCRNPGIANIPNPGDVGITLTTQIPPFTDDTARTTVPNSTSTRPKPFAPTLTSSWIKAQRMQMGIRWCIRFVHRSMVDRRTTPRPTLSRPPLLHRFPGAEASAPRSHSFQSALRD